MDPGGKMILLKSIVKMVLPSIVLLCNLLSIPHEAWIPISVSQHPITSERAGLKDFAPPWCKASTTSQGGWIGKESRIPANYLLFVSLNTLARNWKHGMGLDVQCSVHMIFLLEIQVWGKMEHIGVGHNGPIVSLFKVSCLMRTVIFIHLSVNNMYGYGKLPICENLG